MYRLKQTSKSGEYIATNLLHKEEVTEQIVMHYIYTMFFSSVPKQLL